MIPTEKLNCPLCLHQQTQSFYQSKNNHYFICNHCQLVFLDPKSRLSLSRERAQYDLHQNQINDPEYRNFLSRIYDPLTAQIPPPAKVLDFGCGPGPALAAMFYESGYQVSKYDPYYFPDTTVLNQKYPIITLTEVIEHCYKPLDVLKHIKSLLMPTGILGIMTKRLTQPEKFANWHYKNDPTHVCFFTEASFHWIAEELKMELVICGDDSLLLKNIVL